MGIWLDHQPGQPRAYSRNCQLLYLDCKGALVIVQTKSRRMARIILAWIITALFVFPIYYWITTAFKEAKEIFSVPPTVWSFEPTLRNFEEVFGISLGFLRQQEVLPGGGNFFMAPRLWDSIVVALFSTALAVVISTFAAYALSRMDFRGRHHFVAWVLSTRDDATGSRRYTDVLYL